MPPKQRSVGSKANSKTKSPPSSSARPEGPGENAPRSSEHAQSTTARRRKEVKWSPVFKRLGYVSLIFLVPAILNYAALNQDSRMLVPKGSTLYDIGWGQKMMLHCTGSGLPTVILDAPIGQSSDVWALVQSLVEKRTKVCVYDRAGLGFSDSAYTNISKYSNDSSKAAKDRDRTQPATVERMVDDLHRLVNYASNQPKPLLLVGVDYSTFVARFYTQLYEHDVAGLLLIDPIFEGLFLDEEKEGGDADSAQSDDQTRTWSDFWTKRLTPRWNGVWISAVVGFNRFSLMVGLSSPVEEPRMNDILPKEVILRKKHLMCQPRHLSSAFYEFYFTNDSMNQMRAVYQVKPFPTFIPITIATYRDDPTHLPPKLIKSWKAGQNKLLQVVHPDSKQVILPGSDYLTFYHNPKSVASTILSMVDRWRKESKLAA